MHIRCWGSRGSIPVSGKEYIKYGGDTTCIEIRAQSGDCVIIDAGTGIRNCGNQIIEEHINTLHLLFTHAHLDHLMGFPFFKPLYKKGMTIRIYSALYNKRSNDSILRGIMSRPYFPVQLEDKDIRATLLFKNIPKRLFSIGSLKITTISLSHPKDSGYGFRIEENGKSFVFLTDNELGYVHKGGSSFEEYRQFCRNADLLIHDAEYEVHEYQRILQTSAEPWGHSVLDDVVKLGLQAHVKLLGLFHLNALRTDERVDAMVQAAHLLIQREKNDLSCFAVGNTFSIEL